MLDNFSCLCVGWWPISGGSSRTSASGYSCSGSSIWSCYVDVFLLLSDWRVSRQFPLCAMFSFDPLADRGLRIYVVQRTVNSMHVYRWPSGHHGPVHTHMSFASNSPLWWWHRLPLPAHTPYQHRLNPCCGTWLPQQMMYFIPCCLACPPWSLSGCTNRWKNRQNACWSLQRYLRSKHGTHKCWGGFLVHACRCSGAKRGWGNTKGRWTVQM